MKKITLHEKYFDEYMEKNIFNIEENLVKIDKKHQEIIDNALSDLKKNKKKFIKNFRDWKFQGDFSCPAQISFLHLKVLGVFQFLRFFDCFGSPWVNFDSCVYSLPIVYFCISSFLKNFDGHYGEVVLYLNSAY